MRIVNWRSNASATLIKRPIARIHRPKTIYQNVPVLARPFSVPAGMALEARVPCTSARKRPFMN